MADCYAYRIQADWDEVNESIIRAGVGKKNPPSTSTTAKKRKGKKGDGADIPMDMDMDIDVDRGKENDEEAAADDGVDVLDAVRDATELLTAVRVQEGEREGEEEEEEIL